jgi:hypothetical protein
MAVRAPWKDPPLRIHLTPCRKTTGHHSVFQTRFPWDDWGLSVLTATERRDLLEILEDRQGRGSTIVTSQLPVDQWHEAIGDPTLADAILDRLVHNAHRLNLTGDSMRRKMNTAKLLDPTGQA